MNRARALAEFLPIWFLSRLLRALPPRAGRALGRAAGRLACRMDRRHRDIARRNLERAFGSSMTPAARDRLVSDVFAHFGTVAVDCLMMGRLGPKDIDRRVEYEGVDHLRKAFLKGKGVLVFSGHFGNWEMVALMQGWLGYPMAMVTRPLDNPYLERLLREGRTASGNEVIHKRDAMRGILRAIRNGWCVALVIDQDTRGADHVFVDFFGTPAATTPALALLALKTGAPIVPVFGVPLPDGRYRITYLPEVEAARIAEGLDRRTAVRAITQACTAIIEDQIRRYPEGWLWMHRRWKRRPRDARSVAQLTLKEET